MFRSWEGTAAWIAHNASTLGQVALVCLGVHLASDRLDDLIARGLTALAALVIYRDECRRGDDMYGDRCDNECRTAAETFSGRSMRAKRNELLQQRRERVAALDPRIGHLVEDLD